MEFVRNIISCSEISNGEIAVAIITSLIASIIFYFCFQFIPQKLKNCKIRPRIEFELTEIGNSLFFYLDAPFKHSIHSPSLFQKDLKTESIKEHDFKIALSNKCLNKTYQYDENAEKLVAIGEILKREADSIFSKIQQILVYQQYLTVDEILIIEDVGRLLKKYSYDGNAVTRIGTLTFRPRNPTISYMSENFFKLYSLWKELRHYMTNCILIKKEKRQGYLRYFSLQTDYCDRLIKEKKFKKVKRIVKRLTSDRNSTFQKQVLDFLKMQTFVANGSIEEAESCLVKILKNPQRDKLVCLRGFLEIVKDNEYLKRKCSSICSTEEIGEWIKTVEQEASLKRFFINQNILLMNFYKGS